MMSIFKFVSISCFEVYNANPQMLKNVLKLMIFYMKKLSVLFNSGSALIIFNPNTIGGRKNSPFDLNKALPGRLK